MEASKTAAYTNNSILLSIHRKGKFNLTIFQQRLQE